MMIFSLPSQRAGAAPTAPNRLHISHTHTHSLSLSLFLSLSLSLSLSLCFPTRPGFSLASLTLILSRPNPISCIYVVKLDEPLIFHVSPAASAPPLWSLFLCSSPCSAHSIPIRPRGPRQPSPTPSPSSSSSSVFFLFSVHSLFASPILPPLYSCCCRSSNLSFSFSAHSPIPHSERIWVVFPSLVVFVIEWISSRGEYSLLEC
jgi:hypothetical protein